jgi:hypothetical protein
MRPQGNLIHFGSAAVAAWLIVLAGTWTRADQPAVTFNRHIRPILAENCYACHGPDKNKRESDLRLDKQEGALADLGSRGHRSRQARSQRTLEARR